MADDARPLVSVAIPLHRSRRFVDGIIRNIERIEYPSVEILISDRHLDDDAMDVLGRRFAGDPRVRFLRADDRIGWVEHYNLVLRTATGRYFLWLPHDDSNDNGYITALVEYLERHPLAVLVYGGVEVVGEDGRQIWSDARRDPTRDSATPWTLGSALRMLMFGSEWLPQFHGVFRREPVIERELFIRPTTGNVEADLYWVFAIGLLGEVRSVSTCSYRKQIHDANISVGWGPRHGSHVLDGIVVPYGYLRALASRRERLRALPQLVAWAGLRAIGWFTQSWPWPSAERRTQAKRLAQRLLFGRTDQ